MVASLFANKTVLSHLEFYQMLSNVFLTFQSFIKKHNNNKFYYKKLYSTKPYLN